MLSSLPGVMLQASGMQLEPRGGSSQPKVGGVLGEDRQGLPQREAKTGQQYIEHKLRVTQPRDYDGTPLFPDQ